MKRLEDRNQAFQELPCFDSLKNRRTNESVLLRKSKRLESYSQKRVMVNDHPRELYEKGLEQSDARLFDETLPEDYKLSLLLNHILHSEEEDLKYLSIKSLMNLLIHGEQVSHFDIIQSGVHQSLVSFMYNKRLQKDSLWCLIKLVSGTAANRIIITEAPIIEALMSHINMNDMSMMELSLWCLHSLACDSKRARQDILRTNILPEIVSILNNSISENILESLLSIVSILVKENTQTDILLHIPLRYLGHSNLEINHHCLWILCYLLDRGHINDVPIEKVVECIGSPEEKLNCPALRIAGTLTSSSNIEFTEALIQGSLLDKLVPLYFEGKRYVKREILWCLSNILAGTNSQALNVIYHKCMEFVISAANDPDIELRKEAAWCLKNTSLVVTCQDLRFLSDKYNLIDCLKDAFFVQDARVLVNFLKCLQNFVKADGDFAIAFEDAGGVCGLEKLQYHPNKFIFQKTQKILKTVYNFDDPVEESSMESPEFYILA